MMEVKENAMEASDAEATVEEPDEKVGFNPVDWIRREARIRTREIGQKCVQKFRETKEGKGFRRVPDRMRRTARQLELIISLVDDFRAGTYRDVSWGAIAIMSGALVYSVSPADILPDAFLGVGSLDDAIVLSIAARLVKKELRDYCVFKGLDPYEYFETPSEEALRETPLEEVAHASHAA